MQVVSGFVNLMLYNKYNVEQPKINYHHFIGLIRLSVASKVSVCLPALEHTLRPELRLRRHAVGVHVARVHAGRQGQPVAEQGGELPRRRRRGRRRRPPGPHRRHRSVNIHCRPVILTLPQVRHREPQLLPKLSITPLYTGVRFQTQPELWIDVPIR